MTIKEYAKEKNIDYENMQYYTQSEKTKSFFDKHTDTNGEMDRHAIMALDEGIKRGLITNTPQTPKNVPNNFMNKPIDTNEDFNRLMNIKPKKIDENISDEELIKLNKTLIQNEIEKKQGKKEIKLTMKNNTETNTLDKVKEDAIKTLTTQETESSERRTTISEEPEQKETKRRKRKANTVKEQGESKIEIKEIDDTNIDVIKLRKIIIDTKLKKTSELAFISDNEAKNIISKNLSLIEINTGTSSASIIVEKKLAKEFIKAAIIL